MRTQVTLRRAHGPDTFVKFLQMSSHALSIGKIPRPAAHRFFVFCALLGIGMGAEWPAGAALTMETWPVRSRGFMGGVLQGSWGLGFMLSSGMYGLLYAFLGWRGT